MAWIKKPIYSKDSVDESGVSDGMGGQYQGYYVWNTDWDAGGWDPNEEVTFPDGSVGTRRPLLQQDQDGNQQWGEGWAGGTPGTYRQILDSYPADSGLKGGFMEALSGPIGAALGAAFLPGLIAGTGLTGLPASAAQGATSGLISSGGDLKAALRGGVTGGTMGALGGIGDLAGGGGQAPLQLAGEATGVGDAPAYGGNAGIDAVNSRLGVGGYGSGVDFNDVGQNTDIYTGAPINAAPVGTGIGGNTYGSAAPATPPGTVSIGGMNIPTSLLAGGALAAGTALLGGIGQKSTTTTNIPPLSAEEKALIAANTGLSERQLASYDALLPFQKEMVDLSLADLRRGAADNAAIDAAVSPADRAAQAKADFERNARLGPIQDEILQLQLDQLRQGGRATPEQLVAIKAAADAGIAAGSGDIDAATSRGIGLIADELANARGLRLTDSPMTSEAALLSREGEIQKGSLIKNLRANEANAALNYPLAVQQIQNTVATGQQSIEQNAKQFQDELRNRAYQNRLALTGQAMTGGIGLTSIGSGGSGLSALTQSRVAGATSTGATSGIGLPGLGALTLGVGGLYKGLGFS